MKNKGFSLVELIIVIAIMAILAAAIAPALIRYIDKSRRSDDVASAETINTATQAALANEEAYDEVQGAIPSTGNPVTLAKATAGSEFQKSSTDANISNNMSTFLEEINSSCGGTSPKLKFKKKLGNTDPSDTWVIGANSSGKPVVWLGKSGATTFELQPDICKEYK